MQGHDTGSEYANILDVKKDILILLMYLLAFGMIDFYYLLHQSSSFSSTNETLTLKVFMLSNLGKYNNQW